MGAGPALADVGLNARLGCGAPLSSDFLMSSCSVNHYDRGRAQIYSAALTRELSTFANVHEEIC